MFPCRPSRVIRKSVSLFVSIMGPVFSMFSHGDIVITWGGVGAPSRCSFSAMLIARFPPALSPTNVMFSGR
jgi:hypothetical protein